MVDGVVDLLFLPSATSLPTEELLKDASVTLGPGDFEKDTILLGDSFFSFLVRHPWWRCPGFVSFP